MSTIGDEIANYKEKLQRVNLRDSQQIDKVHPDTWQLKNGSPEELWIYYFQYTFFCLLEEILFWRHQTEPNFEVLCQKRIPWERVSDVLELLHDSRSACHFEIEKTEQTACEGFYWTCTSWCMRNRIESCDVCGKRENTKQKH